MKFRNFVKIGAGASVLGLAATPAFAQDGAAEADGIADIVVTARKAEESLQSVPVAVTALSGDALQTRTVQNVRDIQFNVPGLVNFPEPQGGAPNFAIRGTRQQGITGSQGGVAVYLGYVPLTSTMAIKNSNYDLRSVQVLKGPQGTLFGKNTTGGAIIFTPAAPTDRFEGSVKAQYGNWDRKDVTAVLNLPVAEGIALRAAGRIVKTDGWQKNVIDPTDPDVAYYTQTRGAPFTKNLWAEDNQSFRVSLKVDPADNLTNTTMVDYYHQGRGQTDNQGGIITTATPTCGFLYPGCADDFARQEAQGWKKTTRLFPVYVKGTWWGITNTTEVELGGVTIRNVFGYRDDKLINSEDDDGVDAPILNGYNRLATEAYSNEVNVLGKAFDDRLDYTVGAFWSDQTTDQFVNFNVLDEWHDRDPFGVLPPWQSLDPRPNYYTFGHKSLAGFGQVNYKIDDNMTFTLGARYTHSKLNYRANEYLGLIDPAGDRNDLANLACVTGLFTAPGEAFDAANCSIRRKKSFNSFIFNGGLQYQVDRATMLYVTVSKGFQAGGFNNQMAIEQYQTYSPETVMNFEGGVKKDWELFGRPIRTNLALFYAKYKNQQRSLNGSYSQDDVDAGLVPTELIGSSWISVFNAANSTTWGGELEVSYNVTDAFNISGFYSYINAKYDNFVAPPIGNTGDVSQLSGRPLSSTPKHTANVSATYSVPVNAYDGAVRLSLNAYYRSSVGTDDLYFGPETHVGGYVVANGRIDLVKTLPFDIGFWANNVFNRKYAIYKNQTLDNFGLARTGYGEPRSYGVEATFRF